MLFVVFISWLELPDDLPYDITFSFVSSHSQTDRVNPLSFPVTPTSPYSFTPSHSLSLSFQSHPPSDVYRGPEYQFWKTKKVTSCTLGNRSSFIPSLHCTECKVSEQDLQHNYCLGPPRPFRRSSDNVISFPYPTPNGVSLQERLSFFINLRPLCDFHLDRCKRLSKLHSTPLFSLPIEVLNPVFIHVIQEWITGSQ